jgi:Domain of unknown function (DUF4158)
VEYKEGANRLGFALLLKYFQIDGRFPRQKHDVPVAAIAFIANQLDVSIDLPRVFNACTSVFRTHDRSSGSGRAIGWCVHVF